MKIIIKTVIGNILLHGILLVSFGGEYLFPLLFFVFLVSASASVIFAFLSRMKEGPKTEDGFSADVARCRAEWPTSYDLIKSFDRPNISRGELFSALTGYATIIRKLIAKYGDEFPAVSKKYVNSIIDASIVRERELNKAFDTEDYYWSMKLEGTFSNRVTRVLREIQKQVNDMKGE